MAVQVDHRVNSELLKTLTKHGQREGAAIDAYRHLIDESTDEGVKYLGRLILEEDARHHHLVTEMINRIESWDQGIDIQPNTPAIEPRVDSKLLEATRELIKLERLDAHALGELKHDLHGTPPTSLLPLLVTLMLHDTARHIEILQFIHDYAA